MPESPRNSIYLSIVTIFLTLTELASLSAANPTQQLDADLLIVGGTESGCAAAVQAARMGIERIILVNDIEWLGGQFSAEALVAIDENTDRPGIRHEPPIPRHGAFREIIDRIERDNLARYGVARPGNTRVITTCRPAAAARIFRDWLAPYIARGQIQIHSWYEPKAVTVIDARVAEVSFRSVHKNQPDLSVRANMTIDASDWGDVIRLSGAAYEFGPDLQEQYDEPLAPNHRTEYPLTDMNPITYGMVIVETDDYEPIARPPGYDAENYRTHRWPKDPLWLYETRRLVDHYHFSQIDHPDVLLLCFPAIDYPLDVLPQAVADTLEAGQPGASKKNIVELTPDQRRIIFEDAKRYSRGFLYYLQTEVHDQMSDKTHSYRRFQLTDEFGTRDRMPFKPYVRESLRMKAMYMMRQQDTVGVDGHSANFAAAMYHDGVACWQFEYDFHPTKREFLDDGNKAGPWRCGFREGRTWGPPYSGRSMLPLRSLIPEKLDGLLAAQKNLGFSSIVSAAVRLHDTSMAVGRASGACAAVALHKNIQPRDIPFDRQHLFDLQLAIVSTLDDGQPGMIWPFRDLQPDAPCFVAANMLAITGCLPLHADEVDFRADQLCTSEWAQSVMQRTNRQMQSSDFHIVPPSKTETRGQFAVRWWDLIHDGQWLPFSRVSTSDADGDGIDDRDDALPLDSDNRSLPVRPLPPDQDGLPDELPTTLQLVRQFNFSGSNVPAVHGFVDDHGEVFTVARGFGWTRDITGNQRQRGKTKTLADTFLFTRSHDVWEFIVPNGNWVVDLSIGDAGHEQFGQNVTVEGIPLFRNETTSAGRFAEKSVTVEVMDGRLTVEIGLPESTTNTCLNWLRVARSE